MCLLPRKGRQLSFWAGIGLLTELAKHMRGPGSSGGRTPQTRATQDPARFLPQVFHLPRAAATSPRTQGFLWPWSQGQLKLLSLAGGSGVLGSGPIVTQEPVPGGQDDLCENLGSGHSFPQSLFVTQSRNKHPRVVEDAAPRREQDWAADLQGWHRRRANMLALAGGKAAVLLDRKRLCHLSLWVLDQPVT